MVGRGVVRDVRVAVCGYRGGFFGTGGARRWLAGARGGGGRFSVGLSWWLPGSCRRRAASCERSSSAARPSLPLWGYLPSDLPFLGAVGFLVAPSTLTSDPGLAGGVDLDLTRFR